MNGILLVSLLSSIIAVAYSNSCPKINLAFKRPTVQKNTAWKGVSSRAVDGNNDVNYAGCSCSHTEQTQTPWWRVDLERVFKVKSVKITNRGDCCWDRLSGFEIRVGNSLDCNGNKNALLGGPFSLGKGETKEFSISPPLSGRYVNIVIPNKTGILTLCEVEVYGEP